MMNMSAKKWLWGFGAVFSLLIGIVIALTVYIDPFFHYHKPLLKSFFYKLDNERYQNDGIVRHFNYNAIVTGTSMTQNFKASEASSLFKCRAIKTCFSGGSYKEINDNLEKAYATGHKLKYVFRAVDYATLIQPVDRMRTDLGVFPEYLYNDNPFDDVQYLLNKDVLFRYEAVMLRAKLLGRRTGITSFDEYSSWQKKNANKFGIEHIFKEMARRSGDKQVQTVDKALLLRRYFKRVEPEKSFSEEDRQMVELNVNTNILRLVKRHPETQFYFFFPPHSIVWWGSRLNRAGEINRYIEAEKYAIELLLTCPNIKLYCFGLEHDLVNNLDNYKDMTHYGQHINSQVLQAMAKDQNRLTLDNYKEHIQAKKEYYNHYDYESLLKD